MKVHPLATRMIIIDTACPHSLTHDRFFEIVAQEPYLAADLEMVHDEWLFANGYDTEGDL